MQHGRVHFATSPSLWLPGQTKVYCGKSSVLLPVYLTMFTMVTLHVAPVKCTTPKDKSAVHVCLLFLSVSLQSRDVTIPEFQTLIQCYHKTILNTTVKRKKSWAHKVGFSFLFFKIRNLHKVLVQKKNTEHFFCMPNFRQNNY